MVMGDVSSRPNMTEIGLVGGEGKSKCYLTGINVSYKGAKKNLRKRWEIINNR